MRHNFIDRYSRLASPIHGIPAAVKLVGALLIVLLVVSAPIATPTIHIFIALALLAIAARPAASPWAFSPDGCFFRAFCRWCGAPFAFPGERGCRFRGSRYQEHALPADHDSPCEQHSLLDLLDVLKRWHVPALLVTTLALMYRYLFLLIDEAERMNRARASRTFIAGRRRSWRALGSLIGQLGVRSTERAERIYAAMRARGWR